MGSRPRTLDAYPAGQRGLRAQVNLFDILARSRHMVSPIDRQNPFDPPVHGAPKLPQPRRWLLAAACFGVGGAMFGGAATTALAILNHIGPGRDIEAVIEGSLLSGCLGAIIAAPAWLISTRISSNRFVIYSITGQLHSFGILATMVGVRVMWGAHNAVPLDANAAASCFALRTSVLAGLAFAFADAGSAVAVRLIEARIEGRPARH